MNVNVHTLKKPSRSGESINLTDGFIFDSLTMQGDIGALARVRIMAREQDKYLIIKANQAAHSAAKAA